MNKVTVNSDCELINIDGVNYRVADIKSKVVPIQDPNRPGYLDGCQLKISNRLKLHKGSTAYIVAMTVSGGAQLIHLSSGNSWSYSKSTCRESLVMDDAMFEGRKDEFRWAE